MQFAWKFGVIALVALVLVVLPGGGNALDVVLTALTIVFFAAIALLVARLYRQYRLDIETLDAEHPARAVRLAGDRDPDLHRHRPPVRRGRRRRAVWFALLALASYGLFWVWTRYRRYE